MGKKMRVKKENVILSLICIIPIVNLLATVFMPQIKLNIYRLLFFALLFQIHYFYIFVYKNKFVKLIILDCVLIVSALIILAYGKGVYYLMHTDVFNYWMLITVLFTYSDKNILLKYEQYIEKHINIVRVNTVLTLFFSVLSIITKVGFVSAQRTTVFRGYFSLEHELAYHCIVSYSLLSIIRNRKNEKLNFTMKVIFTAIIVLTGVRSALLAVAVLLLYDMLTLNLNKKIIILVLALIGIGVCISDPNIVAKIPVLSKTVAANQVGDITNGRTELNGMGVIYYKTKMTTSEKLIGITMSNLREKIYWGLHAHNDVLNILIGYGAVYFFITFFLLFIFCKCKNGLVLFLIISILSFFNGLYMYSEMVIMLPALKVAISKCDLKGGLVE